MNEKRISMIESLLNVPPNTTWVEGAREGIIRELVAEVKRTKNVLKKLESPTNPPNVTKYSKQNHHASGCFKIAK